MKKFIVVDFRIDKEEKDNLQKLGYEVLCCPPSQVLYSAVCGHPDMLLHFLNNNTIVVHKNTPRNFIDTLEKMNLEVILSKNPLEKSYPYDIGLNAVNVGDIFIHYTKYTDPSILNNIEGKKILNVKQGYTKCSTAIINSNAFITSDPSIKNVLEKENKDVLFLPPGDISLPGLDYGFIGGTCGFLEEGFLAFYGDLNYYKYGREVMSFLEKYQVKPVFLRKGPLVDRGSLFSGLVG
ncbi:DUF6873 family GME fold protein [Haloimpatiens lingqiaonensis]|uniref:DUF6873 family GME fold protein n=1 Tax=Haloimpatiens lingqiaonensis TaxID=1380675 RepID=UPI0010FE1F95|nr:hypothetical protein [Haloimpatiens lingqiaonensis]